MRTRLFIAALMAAFAATFAPVASAQTFSFSDGVGDAPAGSPDLTTTTASIDANGLITWNINAAVAGAFSSGTALTIRIDSDNSASTGSSGADYAIVVLNGYVYLFSWDGSSFVSAPAAPGLSANLGFPETVTLQTSAIGSPRTVTFQELAYGAAPYYVDTADAAPSALGWWRFDTSTPDTAPTTTGTTPAPTPGAPSSPSAPTSTLSPTAPPAQTTTTLPSGSAAPTAPPLSSIPAPATGASRAPKQGAERALEASKTSWTLRGKRVDVTAQFSRSVAGAHATCSFATGSHKLGTISAKASGKRVTCQGRFRGAVPKVFRVVVTVTLDGTTIRIPVSIPR